MKPTIDSVEFYTTGEVLCNFLNDVELENSVVAAFARIHWRAFELGGLFLRTGSKRARIALRKEIKECVANLISPDAIKLAMVRRRLSHYRMQIQLLEVDTNPVMDHLIDVTKRNRGAAKTGIRYDINTLEVRSKTIELGNKAIITSVGLSCSATSAGFDVRRVNTRSPQR